MNTGKRNKIRVVVPHKLFKPVFRVRQTGNVRVRPYTHMAWHSHSHVVRSTFYSNEKSSWLIPWKTLWKFVVINHDFCVYCQLPLLLLLMYGSERMLRAFSVGQKKNPFLYLHTGRNDAAWYKRKQIKKNEICDSEKCIQLVEGKEKHRGR